MQNILDWLVLARATGIKNETIRFAIDQYGFDPVILKEKIVEHSKNVGCFEKIKFGSYDKISLELENIEKFGAKIIPISEDMYPKMLRGVYNAPLVITAKGNIGDLIKKNIAIIGSRKPTFHSQELATEMGYEIVKEGFIVSSGMASGIDSAAHIGALKNGSTIAVLGSGIDVVYPSENKDLYENICQKGVVITQYPIGTPPRAGNFPVRNQIIAGISLGTVVIEAYRSSDTGRSGSLITAEFANQIGRFVYTIPGFPTKDGRFAGNNYLLKEKIAILVENASDVISHINKYVNNVAQEKIMQFYTNNIDSNQINMVKFKILSILHTIPMSINEISVSTNNSIEIVRAALIELELSGLIVRGFNGKIIKI